MEAPELTPELIEKIVGFVRAGAQAMTAASALGIDGATFESWIALGADPEAPDSLYRTLFTKLERAVAEVRLLTEVELHKRQPRSWLRSTRKSPLAPLRVVPAPANPKLPPRAVLTGKQRAFALAYIELGSGDKAALKAGYSKANPHREADRLLRMPHVQRAIREMHEDAIREGKITARRVLQELAAMAFLDPADMYDTRGNLLPIPEMPELVRRALVGFDVEEIYEQGRKTGTPSGVTKKIKNAKLQALALLGKHLKMFGETLEIGGSDGRPLTIVHLLERLGPIPPGPSRAAIEEQAVEVESRPSLTAPAIERTAAPADESADEIDLSSLPSWKPE
ncbi:MAG TPA: terminase small subunit [Candidatus Binataceae bacterium]|nr:terminase small subunit [Candidatus Binataceae bacterium]